MSISGWRVISLNNKFVLPDPEPPIVDIMYAWSGSCGYFGLCYLCFFCNFIKVNHFLYCFFILLHLICSFYFNRSLLVPYVYASTESIDCILLLLLEHNAILLNSSVNKLCFLLVNCWEFYINLLFFMNAFWSTSISFLSCF